MSSNKLSQRLAKWSDWGLPAEPRLVDTFTSGQNHHTALIESAGQSYVLKVFEHSFEHAIQAQRWAAQYGLSPAVLFAEQDLAIIEYVDGGSALQDDTSSVARSLSSLHQADSIDLGNFDLLKFCQQYLSNADRQIHEWHQALMPALLLFINDSTPWCICHNDLVRENCLLNGQDCVFIDWEYAMRHNPWFDLAAIILYFGLDKNQARAFLANYRNGWQRKVDEPIFHAAQLALLWGDLLWHMNKYGAAYRAKNTPRFDQLSALAQTLSIELPA